MQAMSLDQVAPLGPALAQAPPPIDKLQLLEEFVFPGAKMETETCITNAQPRRKEKRLTDNANIETLVIDPLEIASQASPDRKKHKRSATSSVTKEKQQFRQAQETICSDGGVSVEVLCSQCRRDAGNQRQMSLGEVFAAKGKAKVDDGMSVSHNSGTETLFDLAHEEAACNAAETDPTLCRRCRRTLVVQHMSISSTTSKKGMTGCAFSARLKQYKRQAVETHAAWLLTDSEALSLMRNPCDLCGALAEPEVGRPNGITRLRAVSGETRGMGPYVLGNVATACAICNLMKGVHTISSFEGVCCTIATHRSMGSFGRFPECFPNNISRKSRSSYLGDTARKSKGTIASKTHSLSNAEFNRIVATPCHYCGKESDPPRHYNGLDRLDNSLRVYTTTNAVSCCGTCNMAKGKLSEGFFLERCHLVATRSFGKKITNPRITQG